MTIRVWNKQTDLKAVSAGEETENLLTSTRNEIGSFLMCLKI